MNMEIDELDDLQRMQNEINRLRALIVSGFYEDEAPVYSQGLPTHELQSVLTAEEANGLVSRITDLRAVNARLVEALDAIYEWYDRDGSVGGASIVFEDNRQALAAAKEGK